MSCRCTYCCINWKVLYNDGEGDADFCPKCKSDMGLVPDDTEPSYLMQLDGSIVDAVTFKKLIIETMPIHKMRLTSFEKMMIKREVEFKTRIKETEGWEKFEDERIERLTKEKQNGLSD